MQKLRPREVEGPTYPYDFQAIHQEARLIHPSSYSREALGIHLNGLHVWPSIHQARK
jgi:hypothetical protein